MSSRFCNCYRRYQSRYIPSSLRARLLHHRRSRARSHGGGWGIRSPEGLHPTRFPIACSGVQKRRPTSICAGQRRWPTKNGPVRRWRTRGNCNRNCNRLVSRLARRCPRPGVIGRHVVQTEWQDGRHGAPGSGVVGVSPVVDVQRHDGPALLVDTVPNAILAPACAPQPVEGRP